MLVDQSCATLSTYNCYHSVAIDINTCHMIFYMNNVTKMVELTMHIKDMENLFCCTLSFVEEVVCEWRQG